MERTFILALPGILKARFAILAPLSAAPVGA
jgi:hypothetical protein